MRLFVFLLFGGLLAGQTVQDFTRIYDTYVAAVRTGDYRKVLPILTARLAKDLSDPDDQKEFMKVQNLMAPLKYETLFLTLSEGGQKAEVQAIATLKVPEEVQKERKLPPTQRLELILTFVKEGGQWKWDGPTLLGNPDDRARPKDLIMGSRADYKEGASTSLGGQILRMEKQDAGTVYIIRVLDEEIAAFVPAALAPAGFAPGKIVAFQGAEHRTDKLKFWAEEASLHKQ